MNVRSLVHFSDVSRFMGLFLEREVVVVMLLVGMLRG